MLKNFHTTLQNKLSYPLGTTLGNQHSSFLEASCIWYRILFDDGKQESLLRKSFQLEALRGHNPSWHSIL